MSDLTDQLQNIEEIRDTVGPQATTIGPGGTTITNFSLRDMLDAQKQLEARAPGQRRRARIRLE